MGHRLSQHIHGLAYTNRCWYITQLLQGLRPYTVRNVGSLLVIREKSNVSNSRACEIIGLTWFVSISFGDNTNEVWRSETEKTAFVKLCVCSAFKLCELPCSFIVGVEWIPGASYILTRKVLGPGIQQLRPLRRAGGLQ